MWIKAAKATVEYYYEIAWGMDQWVLLHDSKTCRHLSGGNIGQLQSSNEMPTAPAPYLKQTSFPVYCPCDNSRPPQAAFVQTTFVEKGAIELCKWKKGERSTVIWVHIRKKQAIFCF